MNRQDNQLTMEQELNHRIFSDSVRELSKEQAQELLVQMHKQTLLKENIYRDLFLSQEKDIVDSLFGVRK
ncbi:NblA/ycf18 family protein [Myxosarcina sp. GI1]|uniref:NblA/ycf18 family protein n=1 Tax=Myxosarcina sp. GI1 TaxID=1541065 RepID=UPI00055CA819|nr:NblA/ycf18 family protein [Myxosarcina sp. GI1]